MLCICCTSGRNMIASHSCSYASHLRGRYPLQTACCFSCPLVAVSDEENPCWATMLSNQSLVCRVGNGDILFLHNHLATFIMNSNIKCQQESMRLMQQSAYKSIHRNINSWSAYSQIVTAHAVKLQLPGSDSGLGTFVACQTLFLSPSFQSASMLSSA